MHERKRLQDTQRTPPVGGREQGGASPAAPAAAPTRPRAASIEDVAQLASVSTATVSRVLNKPDLVAPDTARRVQQAVVELGYRPNMLAKGLTTQRTGVIGLALPDIFGEFYSELLRGADDEARQLGYHLLVSSEARLNGTGGGGPGGAHGYVFGLVDGLALMITEPNDALLNAAERLNVPLAVLDTTPEGKSFDSIVVDNEAGTREAVKHLLQGTGADRLRFVGGPKTNFDTQARARAFSACFGATDRSVPDNIAFGDYTIGWGEQWARERLKRGELKGAAVLCANDEIALGVLQVAQEAGLSAPTDLRIVGFDDSRLCRLVRPKLSSVHVPAAAAGAAAVRAIVRRVSSPDAQPELVSLPTRFVARESS
ncbi:MAG: LacI family DNA-binding transcriptional regulator [Phycisphaerales bacterium]